MKKWNELSMADRAKYIKLGVQNGITDIKSISDAYNVYADGGKINRFDEGGQKTVLDSFKESIIPIPMDEYIRETYGYRRYKVPDDVKDSISIRRNRVAFAGSRTTTANNTASTKAEPDVVEVSVSKPGTYFPRDWKSPLKSLIDNEGNYHTDLPDVYQIDDKPLTFGDKLYRTVTSAIEANPITSSTRVSNMQNSDMSNYFDMSPRQAASGLSVLGNILTYFPEPRMKIAGYVLQSPDAIYDTYDAIFNPSIKNTASVIGDAAGVNKLTKYVKPFKLPSFDIPSWTFTDGEGNRLLSIPGGTIGGQAINPMYIINALKAFGIIDDVAGATGYDLLDFNKAEDPDTIRIHKTPQGGYGEYIHTPWEEFNKRKEEEKDKK